LFVFLTCIPAQASPIRDGHFNAEDGTRLHYLEAGRLTAAPSLLLIPGWTLSATLWREQLERFSEDRLVIAVDPRSQAESAQSLEGNTPEGRARDLHVLAAHLGIAKFVIVGWSQGSQDVAAYINSFGTASLAGIVFVDSPVSAGPAEITLRPAFSKAILSNFAVYANHPAEFSEGMVHSIFAKPHPELDMQALLAEARKTPPPTGTQMLVMDIFGVDRTPALRKIDRPTLVIASSKSPLLEAQKEMAASIADARFLTVEGAGHALFVDDPQLFDDALKQLLKQADAAGK
jgi:microsomal epoxide hydrolase